MNGVPASSGFPRRRTMSPILSAEQKQQFIDDGYCLVRGLFPNEQVQSIRAALLADLGASDEDPSTHPNRARSTSWAWGAGHFTTPLRNEKVEQVVTELVGPHLPQVSYHTGKEFVGLEAYEEGYIPVLTYPLPSRNGQEKKFIEPQGWHYDGIHGTAMLPDILMMVIFVYLNDVSAHGGATSVKPGSHRQTFEAWQRKGEMIPLQEMMPQFGESRPLPGKAGDVIFFHYLLVHSGSDNLDDHIRVGLNTAVHQDPEQPYQLRSGAPDATWTPFDYTLRTDTL